MHIEWVNHASFILEYKDLRLITDPWIEGRVFNQSWGLLAETSFNYDDFSSITHIWFSHEHPDHFFPPNIKKIPAEIRENITVLFQSTIDEKVSDFCKKLGFKEVIEIKDEVPYPLTEHVVIRIGKVVNDTDSWLHIQTPDFTVMNLNDCTFSEKDLDTLARRIGRVDLLLTQFSFAKWIGNRTDEIGMQSHARKKLDEIGHHIRAFRPTFTIPFASFVWFCHEDNFHFNAFANRIDMIQQHIDDLESRAVVLYPGDRWKVGEGFEGSEKAIERYMADHAALAHRELTTFDSVSEEELKRLADRFIEKSLDRNSTRKLTSYRPLRAHLTDKNEVYSLSYRNGFQKVDLAAEDADISFHSQNLSYCLSHDWGFNTILIAGTFQKPPGGDFQNFKEYQWVAHLNNHGKKMKGTLGRLIDKVVK
ncbi:MAG: MBL fold metallo-hydrolase [Flavobacteriales bacterium]|nr:MBL fold metallo-hydrolase [Flavobacteriales bacterium]